MNFYEHHIGDYDSATSHLSMLEDAAYRRLICLYYRTEAPIPADIKQACRLIRAVSKQEQAAAQQVLHEFFRLEADGWHNDRCDAEVARYVDGAPEREIKKANETNRMKRHREERAALFKAVTDAGQHAPWNIGMTELRAMTARIAGVAAAEVETPKARQMPAPETQPATQPATAPATPATATQSPLPTTHYPEDDKYKKDRRTTNAARVPRDDDDQPKTPAEWVEVFEVDHGLTVDHRSVHDRGKFWPLAKAWTNAGVTVGQMRRACARAQAEATEPIAYLPAYVDRVLASLACERAPPAEPAWRREQRERIEQAVPGIAARRPGPETIDVEAKHVLARTLG